MSKRRLKRGDRGVFSCAICGQSICSYCDELAAIENSVLDGCPIEALAGARDKCVERDVEKGGDRERILKQFRILWL